VRDRFGRPLTGLRNTFGVFSLNKPKMLGNGAEYFRRPLPKSRLKLTKNARWRDDMSGPTTSIKIKVRYLPEIWLTPAREVLIAEGTWQGCVKPRWKPAGLIKEPRQKGGVNHYDHVIVPRMIESRVPVLDFRPFVKRATRLKKWAKEPTELTETMAELFGWYVAEGSISSTAVQFSLGTEDEVSRVKKLIELMDMRPWFSRLKRQKGYLVIAPSRVLARACEVWFGRGAKNKKIPRFLLEATPNLARAFLRGYIKGDGCERIYRNSWIVEISSVSKTLILQIQALLMRLGLMAGYHKQKAQSVIQGRRVNSSPIHSLIFAKHPKYKFYRADKEFYYFPVERVKQIPPSDPTYDSRTSQNGYFIPFIIRGASFENSLEDDFTIITESETKTRPGKWAFQRCGQDA